MAMKISRRAEHAVRAMLDLALHGEAGARASEIARRAQVPEKFLDAILLELRRAGLITSKRGPDGGHWLAREPAQITVGEILLAVDGASSIAAAVRPEGASPAALAIESLWASVTAAVREITEQTTIEELRRRAAAQAGGDYCI